MTEEEGSSEWAGQIFALLLVAGLLGLVVWFARGYDSNPDVSFADDASSDAGDDDAGVDGGDASEDAPDEESIPSTDLLQTALFGVVVTQSDVTALPTDQGCVLGVSLTATPAVGQVRLYCDALVYESPAYDGAGEVTEAISADGPIYQVRHTSPVDQEGMRVSIDTGHGTILVADGETRARLVVDLWSAARPGEPFDPTAPEVTPPAFDADGCDLAQRYEGRVLLADEELSPLTLTVTVTGGVSPRIELFDARAEIIEGFDFACAEGGVSITGERTRFESRFGPRGASIVGRVELDSEAGLFWLAAARPSE